MFYGVLLIKPLIFLHSHRTNQRNLLAALQKVVVPIYCTSFLEVEEDKQQKITRVRSSIPISSHLQLLYGVNLTCSRKLSCCSSCFQLLLLWEKNSYFDDVTIQQLQSPALGLGQYQVQLVLSVLVFWLNLEDVFLITSLLCLVQASLITEYAPVVQPVQMAFQQQIQVLKTQHEEFVNNLKQQQTAAVAAAAAAVGQLTPADADVKTQAPLTSQPGKNII